MCDKVELFKALTISGTCKNPNLSKKNADNELWSKDIQ
jgi:hypothetical protein